MSLLDGRTSVLLTPVRIVRDEWGTTSRQELEPVEVACTVKWQNPSEMIGFVTAPGTAVKVLARSWPGNANCRFVWDGMTFEQVGPTQKYYGSDLTSHCEVFARLISHPEEPVEEDTDGQVASDS